MTNLNNKLIPIYLKEHFESNQHLPVTRKDLNIVLELKGIHIARKALGEYINALRLYGMDIVVEKGRNGAYFFQEYKEVNYNV